MNPSWFGTQGTVQKGEGTEEGQSESKDKTWQVWQRAEERWNCGQGEAKGMSQEVRKGQVGRCWERNRSKRKWGCQAKQGVLLIRQRELCLFPEAADAD